MNVTLRHAPAREHGSGFWFVRHLLAMTVAMLLGMAAYALVLGLAPGVGGSDLESARLGQPELFALGMAASMSVPMVAWMRRRNHGWRASGEMTAAMFVPAIGLIACYWLHAVAADAICPIACATMIPAMVVAMLYRRGEYTCRRPVSVAVS
jgi:flagellar biosynthetic protein FliP